MTTLGAFRGARAALLTASLMLAALVPTLASAATTYYFSTSGSDRQDGLSPLTPRRSLEMVPELLAPGVTVLLRRGDIWHVDALIWNLDERSGTADAPMRIGAYGNPDADAPSIRVARTSAPPVLQLRGTRHLVVEDLDWSGPEGWRALSMEGAGTGVDLRRVTAAGGTRPALLGAPTGTLSPGTYYLSTSGSDATGAGTEASPWYSVSRIDEWIGPGVTILLKRGDEWHDPTCVWDLSYKGGTAQSPMRIGAYGSGPKPVVAKMVLNAPASWSATGVSNRWSTAQYNNATTDRVFRLYVGGNPIPKVPNVSSLVDDSYCVENGTIYVQITGQTTAPTTESIQLDTGFTFYGWGVNYLTIEDIEFRGGDEWTMFLFMAPSNYLVMRNCDLKQFRSYGINITQLPVHATNTNTNFTIENCYVDRGWTSAMNDEYAHTVGGEANGANGGQPGGDGIAIGHAANGGLIRGCTVTNEGHSAVGIGYSDVTNTAPGVQNVVIEQNVLTAGNSPYCRAIAVGGPSVINNNIVRRNYCHDQNVGSQLGGELNYYYSNIWDTTNESSALETNFATVSLGFFVAYASPTNAAIVMKDNVFANNTLVGAGSHFVMAGQTNDGNLAEGNKFSNNVMLDWRPLNECLEPCRLLNAAWRADSTFADAFDFQNNGFYDTDGSQNVFLVERVYPAADSYTVDLFNARGNAAGNQYAAPQFVGGSGATPDKFKLSGTSPYVTGGVPLSQLLPSGVDPVDFYGRTYGPNPSRGAIQFGIALTDIAITGAPTDTVDVGTQVSLTSVRTPSNADVLSYFWAVRTTGNPIATGSSANFSYSPSAPTTYTFTVTATDYLGNRDSAQVTVVVAELPRIDLYTAGGPLASGSVVNVNVLAQVFNATTALTVTRNGGAYSMPGDGWFSLDGAYVISAEGVTFVQKSFTIDKTAPIVSGVTNGAYYNTNRNPTFNEGTATLNGAAFTSGGTVSAEQAHTLVVTDAAGNVTTVGFTIDKTAPIVSNVTNGTHYNTNRNPTFNEGTATLNGGAFTSGSTVSAEGTYSLVVTDLAGNVTTVGFTIDKTAPVITGEYKQGQTWTSFSSGGPAINNKKLRFGWTEANVSTRSLTINGNAQTWNGIGDEYDVNGSYVVTVTDLAGNQTVFTATRN